jgi:Xaa-Pro aminopeptidase
MKERIQCLRNRLKSRNIEGMIISNPVNIRYLTGLDAEGLLLLTRKENIYITDARYIEMVRSLITIEDDLLIYNVADLTVQDYEGFFMFCENVGFEEGYITYSNYKNYIQKYKINNFVETEEIIEKQRIIKDEEEIINIRKACEITDRCFNYLTEFIKIGMTEKEIAYEIEKFFMENGADGLAFDSIVASGVNSSKPHAVPTEKQIEFGDIITIDMGCKYNGYCSDMTRTIFIGEINENIKKVYDLVLKNQEVTLTRMYDGANIKIITKMLENDFESHGYQLVHALGHGVGLDIHENPVISSKRENLLIQNMVVTDEPGIYIPGKFGIRIEDTVLITKDGYEVLTKSNKECFVI